MMDGERWELIEQALMEYSNGSSSPFNCIEKILRIVQERKTLQEAALEMHPPEERDIGPV